MTWLLPVFRVLGIIAMAMSVTHVLPIATSLIYRDGTTAYFTTSMLVNFAAGSLLWIVSRGDKRELILRQGILLVLFVWTGGALFATVPLQLALPELSFTHAYFEAMSALTATGSTALSSLDQLPASVNVWRAELQWLGGMGVIVLVVAVLPMLGVGGRQISKSEIPGPMKDEQLTPRLTETAKGLWLVYAGLTLACFVAYHAAGMTWLDALIHSFTTVSLGGYSSHDASLAYFNSPLIESIAMLFMLAGGINFATHFLVLRQRSFAPYARDTEVHYFILTAGVSVVGIAFFLWSAGVYAEFPTALRYAAFNVISFGTTTGYTTADYNAWPGFAALWMLFLGTFLCCSGSAGGGIKMIRAIILYRQVYRELNRLAHPSASLPLKVAGQVMPNQVVFAVLAFFFVWVAMLISMTLLLGWSGVDPMTAFSAVTATLCNIGPGLNKIGPTATFAVLTDLQLWICVLAMLFGRLELFTVLVVFTPTFWRK